MTALLLSRSSAQRLSVFVCATLLGAPLRADPGAAAPAAGDVVQRVEPNDQRRPAGRIVNGERQIELDIVRATWRPDELKSAVDTSVAFAERGHAPQNPGPLLRLQAGIPVLVRVHNTLDKPVQLRGLGDRVRGDTAIKGLAGFMQRAALVLAPGETREVQFTPTTPVTSFYYANVVSDTAAPPRGASTGALAGAFIVDAVGSIPDAAERIFMITSGLSLSINGLEWPRTERLRYAQGETVRWRVINFSRDYHPMHLHGFYFTVTARGDTQSDTTIRAPQPLAVTEGMRERSSMQLTWIAERAGNWLFHCHLLVHTQSSPRDSAATAAAHQVADGASDMPMHDGMAGLIMGITVTPRVAATKEPPPNIRRLDLWTGTRPRMFGDAAGYGFVLQRGAARPAPDSIVVPGTPLVLTRGEPARIVVHNRLPVPLAVHWHGIELESYYDGVGHWSGAPGKTRTPIAPGDSMNVYMTPPRAGSFMYHIHGEARAELQQGLYGALLVVEKGQRLNADTDRSFVLASRGAGDLNPAAAINGRGVALAERFDAGTAYRLRFLHISTNDIKTVRLLKDGKPVQWRPLARDGATLPMQLRTAVDATMRMDVGQTVDVEWTPSARGIYVLEVETAYLTFPGPPMQRVAFGVGSVTDAELRIAATGTALPLADPSGESLEKLAGVYGDQSTELVSVWHDLSGLALSHTVANVESPGVSLMSLANGTFVPATTDSGRTKEALPLVAHRFDGTTLIVGSEGTARRFPRMAGFALDTAKLARFAGRYARGTTLVLKDGTLTMRLASGTSSRLVPISPSRFAASFSGNPLVMEVVVQAGKVVTLRALEGAFTAARLPDN
ncbi:MAG: multicopper oxidase domain-containing protein [Gemmatimonadaceae bacterium]